MNSTFTIRACGLDDAETLVALVRELAIYENMEECAKATPEAFRVHLFGPRPSAEAFLAEVGAEPAGFAIVFQTFSTFRGELVLYLEDIFVKTEYRGRGIGKALLANVARIAIERGCSRVDWVVLKWNEPAIRFYRGLGARPLDDWTIYRIDDEPLSQLAALAPSNPGESSAG
jgi:ribosomal protein S18 acetylase RimI-like enzyme